MILLAAAIAKLERSLMEMKEKLANKEKELSQLTATFAEKEGALAQAMGNNLAETFPK